MAGRRGAQPSQKERAEGSPRPGSPRRKQAEHQRLREDLGKPGRSSTKRTCEGRRKRDGRASLKEQRQRAPPKKEKEALRKETRKRPKKHRYVVILILVHLFLKIYLFEREREGKIEHKQGEGQGRGRRRLPLSREPDRSSIPGP